MGGYVTSQSMIEAIHELYNPAQLDVLDQARSAALEEVQSFRESGEGPESRAG